MDSESIMWFVQTAGPQMVMENAQNARARENVRNVMARDTDKVDKVRACAVAQALFDCEHKESLPTVIHQSFFTCAPHVGVHTSTGNILGAG